MCEVLEFVDLEERVSGCDDHTGTHRLEWVEASCGTADAGTANADLCKPRLPIRAYNLPLDRLMNQLTLGGNLKT